MEIHEKEFIVRNKASLLDYISCTTKVIESLVAKELLSQQDAQNIRAEATSYSQTTLLLDILVTRGNNSYQGLIDTLKAEKQTGAVKLLESINRAKYSENLGKLADTLEDWLKKPTSYAHNLVLFSHNVNYSNEWISISTSNYATLEYSENLRTCGNMSSSIFQEQTSGYFGSFHDRFLFISDHRQKQNIVLPDTWGKAEDRVKWSDLTSDIQDLLLSREVLFQNQKVSLSFICEFILKLRGESASEPNFLDNLDSKLLVELVSGRIPQIVEGSIPNKGKYYINRMLRPRHRIARVVLNETRNEPKEFGDIFVIKCDTLRLYQFQSFVDKYGNQQCDLWSNQIKLPSINVNAILLNTVGDYGFDQICKRSGKRPVHLLKGTTDKAGQICKLFWIRSQGSMQTLQKYVHRNQAEIDEKKICGNAESNSNTTPVCISDTAGKGKTYLLTHLAKNLQTLASNHSQNEFLFVNYITMHELFLDLFNKEDNGTFSDISDNGSNLLNATENESVLSTDNCHTASSTIGTNEYSTSHFTFQDAFRITPDKIIRALIYRSSKYWIGREFVAELLSTQVKPNAIALRDSFGLKFKLELMFDGIDELDTTTQQDGLEMVQVIQHKIKFLFPSRLWFATRPHLLESMEDLLETLGYEICPFTKDQQIDLLVDMWIKDTNNIKRTSMKIVATETLNKLHEKISEPDERQDVAGLPLLCSLLAKVFKNAARNICRHNQQETNFSLRITDLTITSVFKQFIDNRFQSAGDENINNVHLCHMENALKLLFRGCYKPGQLGHITPLQNQDIFKYGITEPGNSMQAVKFIHTTFAYYFSAQAALKVVDSLQSWDSEKEMASALESNFYLLREVLFPEDIVVALSNSDKTTLFINAYKFKHPNTCYFLNFSINFIVNTEIIVKLFLEFKPDKILYLTKQIWQYLMVAIFANHYNIAYPLVHALKLLLVNLETYEIFSLKNPDYVISDLVMLSAKYAGKELMKLISEFNDNFTTTPIKNYQLFYKHVPDAIPVATITPLHISFEAGNFNVANFFISEEKFLEEEEVDLFKYKDLLHACIINSVENSSKVVSRKKEIIHLLKKFCPNLFVVSRGVEFERMHLALLLEYLKVREKVETDIVNPFSKVVANKYGENIMHLLPQGHYDDEITPQKYHNALAAIKDIFQPVRFLRYIYAKNAFGWRAIDVAASKLNMLPQTFKLLDDMLKRSKKHHQEHVKLLNRLEEKSKKAIEIEFKLYEMLNIETSHNEIRTILLHLQDLQKNKADNEISKTQEIFIKLEKQRAFVEQVDNLDYNCVDFRSSNILYKAVAGQRDIKFLQQLLDLKVEFKPKYYDFTILHVAAANFNYAAVTLFVKHCKVNVNAVDLDGNTPLHMCFRSDEIKKIARDFKYSKYNAQIIAASEKQRCLDAKLKQWYNHQNNIKSEAQAKSNKNRLDIVHDQNECHTDNLNVKTNQQRHSISKKFSLSEDNILNTIPYSAGTNFINQRDNRLRNFYDNAYQAGNLISRRFSWSAGDVTSHICHFLAEMHTNNSKTDQPDNVEAEMCQVESSLSEIDNTSNASSSSSETYLSNPNDDPVRYSNVKAYQPGLSVCKRFSISEDDMFDTAHFSAGTYQSIISLSKQHPEIEPNNQHKIIQFLIKNGADIGIPNKNGRTPLHFALDMCLEGLNMEEKEILESSERQLFEKSNLTLALKGLLCNNKLGYLWHPSLIFSFADKIKQHGGDINTRDDDEGGSLLHWAARKHSFYGVKYLIEIAEFSAGDLDDEGNLPIDFMQCGSDCKAFNCPKIKQ